MRSLQKVIAIYLLFYVNLSLQKSTPSDSHYVAGVAVLPKGNDGKVLDQLRVIRGVLNKHEAQIPDIIVFPEKSISNQSTYIPDSKERIAPCDNLDYAYFLSELSCFARMVEKYLVFNVEEKVLCPGDSRKCKRGTLTYNTNVVFDRKGTVISKYRKSHLYGEEIYEAEAFLPENQIFTTDFGVNFAHFIGFDILFYSPAQILVDKHITDFVHPSQWSHELPFLNSLQVIQGWAHSNDVNLLSSSRSGSGIYAGEKGDLTNDKTAKILTAKVPKKNFNGQPFKIEANVPKETDYSNHLTNPEYKRDHNIDLFTTELINSSKSYENYKLCHNEFCCNFTMKFQKQEIFVSNNSRKYNYRMAAYKGPGTLQRMEKANLGICSLIACTDENLSSCGNMFMGPESVNNGFIFTNISIKSTFEKKPKMLVMPSTLNSALEPLHIDLYRFSRNNNEDKYGESGEIIKTVSYEISLNRPRYDIITFGQYGNYYVDTKSLHNIREEESKLTAIKNFASSHSSSFLAVFLVAVAVLVVLIYKTWNGNFVANSDFSKLHKQRIKNLENL